MPKTLLVRNSAVALIIAASLTQANAGAFMRSTAADQPVRIASHATWSADCTGGPSLVEVVEPPRHGTLYAKTERTVIRRIETGSARCAGHPIDAKAVFYRPAHGFTGTDDFYYTSTTARGTVLTHEGVIDIR